MAGNTKTSRKVYAAWDYTREIADLNRDSEEGWQLIKGGCFRSRFVRNEGVRYRYQIDFGKIEDMPRYVESFREQGWEYVSSTIQGWHYFRKLYDPALPESAYEIYTDRESLEEMQRRWAKVALRISLLLGVVAVIAALRLIFRPSLVTLSQLLVPGFEFAVLFRGAMLMRKAEERERRAFPFGLFLTVLLLGCAAMLTLIELRPHFGCSTCTEECEPMTQVEEWVGFTIRYPDNYYLDLSGSADSSVCFTLVDEQGELIYAQSADSFAEKNVQLKLRPGNYSTGLLCPEGGGFELDFHVD